MTTWYEDVIENYQGKIKQEGLVKESCSKTFEELLLDIWPKYPKETLRQLNKDFKDIGLGNLDVVTLLECYLKM